MSDSSDGRGPMHSAHSHGRAALKVALLASCLAFFPIGCVEGAIDMTNIMDGSGVGLLPGDVPIWILMFFAAMPMIVCIRFLWKRIGGTGQFTAVSIAALTLLLFVGSGFCRTLFALSWTHRCALGEPRACYAAARLYAQGRIVPRDRSRADALYRRACDGSHVPSCHEVLDAAPGDPRACGQLAQQCASGDKFACEYVCL